MSHDADCNSTSKSRQTNHISYFVALSPIPKSSITKNTKYYGIWKAPETGEYTSVYYQCTIANTESDMIRDDRKMIKIN